MKSKHIKFDPSIVHLFSGGTNTHPTIHKEAVYLDGYTLYGRQYEDVPFKFVLDEDGLGVTVSINEDTLVYLKNIFIDLNELLQDAAERFTQLDVFSKNVDLHSEDITDEIMLWTKKDFVSYLEKEGFVLT